MNAPLSHELLLLLSDVMESDPVVLTIGSSKPNRIIAVQPDGVLVATERSEQLGRPPQLVPAWMIERAWSHLTQYGELENRYLLANDGLSVKRSSAVIALLARLPGVTVASTRPIRLTYGRSTEPT